MAIFQEDKDLIERLNWIGWAFLIVILVLFLRLWYLSVASFNHYDSIARSNHIRNLSVLAPRGPIQDRKGRILVENTYGFDLVMFRGKESEINRTVEFLSQALKVVPEEIEARFLETSHYNLYQPVVVSQGLTLEQTSFLMARLSDYPVLDIIERPRRSYPHRTLAAHVLGYVGEISSDELKSERHQNHRPGDVIGKSGTEWFYNGDLAGRNGLRRIRVDSQGRAFEELKPIETRAGHELRLTIDLELQKAAEEALSIYTGAIVAIDPRSGEILAMASRPTFDPNDFATRISPSKWKKLATNPGRPFQNRAIQNGYPPGSIFKIVMALASLDSEVTKTGDRVFCTGSQRLFGHDFRCGTSSGHGWVDLEAAIQYSCNVYFYLMGRSLGIDRIHDFALKFGLGQGTGIDLPGEFRGLVPSPEWKRKTSGASWYPGETISVSIGQGPILVTPLQLAVAVAAVATERMVQPHIRLPTPGKTQNGKAAVLDAEALATIRSGMWRAVNQNGTARSARIEGFEVVGKTGTAQVIGRVAKERLGSSGADRFRSTAWFVGYAPRNDPQIVVAVLLEQAGSGGVVAAPVARKVFQVFFLPSTMPDPDLPIRAQVKIPEVRE